jgi:hypothetical protein
VTVDRVGTSPLAGQPAGPGMLIDVPALVAAYYTERPDPAVPAQRVAFGCPGSLAHPDAPARVQARK